MKDNNKKSLQIILQINIQIGIQNINLKIYMTYYLNIHILLIIIHYNNDVIRNVLHKHH